MMSKLAPNVLGMLVPTQFLVPPLTLLPEFGSSFDAERVFLAFAW